MTSEDLARLFRDAAFESTVRDTRAVIESPPGRAPRDNLVAASAWYKSLRAVDRHSVDFIVRLATREAILAVLALLDGLRVPSSELERVDFEIYSRGKDGNLQRVGGEGQSSVFEAFAALIEP